MGVERGSKITLFMLRKSKGILIKSEEKSKSMEDKG
jgi:hypothetical protein